MAALRRNAQTASINAYLTSRPDDKTFNKTVTEAIEGLIDKQRANVDAEIYQVGVPVLKQTIGDFVARDILTLSPFSIVIVFGILILFFRSGTAAILPLVTGSLSIVCTLDFMAYMGFALNPVNAIVPTLLIVIGCTEDIHLLSEYGHQLSAGRTKIDAIRSMAVLKDEAGEIEQAILLWSEARDLYAGLNYPPAVA
ncbi:MAG: MMPL family transporter, partial [Alphaproteobacteria bacterium]|nr:MMPL family transporter [Alphaproteobacteria bacterium]